MSQKHHKHARSNHHSRYHNPVTFPDPISVPSVHRGRNVFEWRVSTASAIGAAGPTGPVTVTDSHLKGHSTASIEDPNIVNHTSASSCESCQLNTTQENGVLNENIQFQNANEIPDRSRASVAAQADPADAWAFYCLHCTGAFVLTLYMIQIGLWSYVFHQIYIGLPHTFAWEKLLRLYGSHYDDCVDRSSDIEVELKPWTTCSNSYTLPCIPIFALVLLLLNIFTGSSCLSKPRSKKVFKMVGSITMWHFVFTILALVFSSVYFHQDVQHLEQTMVRGLNKGLPASSRWELTQTINDCCGLYSPLDWDLNSNATKDNNNGSTPIVIPDNVILPQSCYTNSTLNEQPCYAIEVANVRYWAIFEISLLCAGLVTTCFFFCLATAIHGGARESLRTNQCHGNHHQRCRCHSRRHDGHRCHCHNHHHHHHRHCCTHEHDHNLAFIEGQEDQGHGFNNNDQNDNVIYEHSSDYGQGHVHCHGHHGQGYPCTVTVEEARSLGFPVSKAAHGSNVSPST